MRLSQPGSGALSTNTPLEAYSKLFSKNKRKLRGFTKPRLDSPRLGQHSKYLVLDWLSLNYSVFHSTTQVPLDLYCGHHTTTGCTASPASSSCSFVS